MRYLDDNLSRLEIRTELDATAALIIADDLDEILPSTIHSIDSRRMELAESKRAGIAIHGDEATIIYEGLTDAFVSKDHPHHELAVEVFEQPEPAPPVFDERMAAA